MNPNDQAFVDLCAALRALGATSVESEGRKATFSGQLPKPRQEVTGPAADDLDRFPGRRR